MQASLRQVGVEQMDIYLLGRRLVMVVEMRDGLDYRTAFTSHAASSPRVAEWERLMKSLQEPASRGAGRRMVGRHGAGLSSGPGDSRSRPLPTSPIGRARPEPGAMTHLRQAWAVPSRPRPIVIIGAGGVVRTAHLPVYQRLKFPVAGLYDINLDASRETARRFGVSTVFASLAEAAGCAGRGFRRRRARRSDCRRAEGAAARRGRAHSEADGRRSRGRAIDRGHLPRARPGRGDEFSAALQPERARACAICWPAASSARSSTSKCGWS